MACAGTDGIRQTFDGILVGADRSKDLCVVKINVSPVSPDLTNSESHRDGWEILEGHWILDLRHWIRLQAAWAGNIAYWDKSEK